MHENLPLHAPHSIPRSRNAAWRQHGLVKAKAGLVIKTVVRSGQKWAVAFLNVSAGTSGPTRVGPSRAGYRHNVHRLQQQHHQEASKCNISSAIASCRYIGVLLLVTSLLVRCCNVPSRDLGVFSWFFVAGRGKELQCRCCKQVDVQMLPNGVILHLLSPCTERKSCTV
jgi:hypothetical protein